MIDEGDKIAVCLSGGKDSITMLNGLKALQRFYPKHFEIIAISINPGFEFFYSEFLKKVCDDIGVPFYEEENGALLQKWKEHEIPKEESFGEEEIKKAIAEGVNSIDE